MEFNNIMHSNPKVITPQASNVVANFGVDRHRDHLSH